MNPREVYQLAVDVGLDHDQAIIATSIAWGESELNPNAVGDTTLQDSTWGPSIGLWQIRSIKAEYGTNGTRDASRLKEPKFNAKSMRVISRQGNNWQPWSVYTNGSYRRYMDQVRRAVDGEESMVAIENGPVVLHAQRFANACMEETGVDTYKTYNGHQPTRDRALDIWGTSSQLDHVADYGIDTLSRYGITYIIWKQHIYNPTIALRWRQMEDRGSVTNNHFDHVHISFDATAPDYQEEEVDDMADPQVIALLTEIRDLNRWSYERLGQLVEAIDADQDTSIPEKLASDPKATS